MTIQRVDYGALIQKAAKKYGVDPQLVQSVIQVESSGNPSAASGTGPVGLMQISEALAKDYGYSLNDRLDPAKNIDMGTRYLAQNLKAFGGDTSKALLGYNQGTGGARQMLSGKLPMAPEGAKYITRPEFQQFINNRAIANPIAALQQTKPDNTFSPALLNREAAQAAPTQAEAMAGAATPITAQQIAQQNQLFQGGGEDQQQPTDDRWGDAALAALSMIAGRTPNKQSVESWSGVGRGASQWSPETQRVMQLLNRVTSAPHFGGGGV